MKTPDGNSARPQLTFMVGLPRSGTTWLQRMLGGHPEIGTAQESHLFNHFLGSQIAAWDHLLTFEDGRGGIGVPAYQTEDTFLETLRCQVHNTLAEANEYHTCKVFIEKTPDHIRHLLDIQRVLPDARFIIVTRRPADIIESMMSAGAGWGSEWAPTSILRAIRLYRFYSRKGFSDFQQADQNRIHVVSYEDLKANTRTTMTTTLSFLGLNTNPKIVSALLAENTPLHLYGEFARRQGSSNVKEPEGFIRAKKGTLNVLQRILVHIFIGNGPDFRAPEHVAAENLAQTA